MSKTLCRWPRAACLAAVVGGLVQGTGCARLFQWDDWALSASDPDVAQEMTDVASLKSAAPAGFKAVPASATHPSDAIEPPAPVTLDLSQGLTVDEALALAAQQHPTLRTRMAEIDVAQAAWITAGIIPNPQLVMDTDSPVRGEGPTDLTTRITFTVPTGGKRWLGRAAAAADIRKAHSVLDQETHAILQEVAGASLEVLYLQELLALQDELSKLASDTAKTQKERADAGKIRVTQGLAAEIDAVDFEFNRLKTTTALEVARVRLSLAVGQSPPQLLKVKGRLAVLKAPLIPLETLLAVAEEVRPELAAAAAGVEASRWRHRLALAQRLPDFEFGPRYQERFGDPFDSVGARFQTEIPLFDRNQGGVAGTGAQIDLADAGFATAQLTTLSDVASVYVQLAPIQARLEYYEQQVLPLAKKTDQRLREAFESGVVDTFEILDHQRRFGRLRADYLELLYLHNQIRVKLELLLGGPLAEIQERTTPPAEAIPPDGLKPVPAPPPKETKE